MQRVSTKLAVILLISGCVLLPRFVSAAEVQIAEIMYSPSGTDSGYEWVEVHNQSDTKITLTNWRLRENDTDHLISVSVDATVGPSGRAIIADDPQKAQSKYTQMHSPVFDSTFSLNNGGESLGLIRPDGTVADSVIYDPHDGADGDGNSLQLLGGSWRPGSPTPQTANSSNTETESQENSEGSMDAKDEANAASRVLQPRPETEDQTSDGEAENKQQTVQVDAGSDVRTIAGVQLRLQGKATSTRNEHREAEVFWSLGNGDTKKSADIFYTYQHPGEYVATLVYRSQDHRLADQIIVSVDQPELQITERRPGPDGYTKIANDLSRDVNLSGWHVRSGGKVTMLPDYTIVLANSTLTLDNQTTGLTNNSMQLLYPDGTVADTHLTISRSTTSATFTDTDSTNQTASPSSPTSKKQKTNADTTSLHATSNNPTLESLFATGSQSAVASKATNESGFWRWGFLMALITIVGAMVAVITTQLTQNKEEDLLSDTFNITEM
jgi:hypothetical protein